MKYLLLLVVTISLPTLMKAQGQTAAPDSIWLSDAAPRPGETVRISFHSDSSLFSKSKTVNAGLYSFDKKNAIKAVEVTLTRQGDTWVANVTLPDTSVAIAISASGPSGDVYKSVAIGLSGPDGKPLKDGYNSLQFIYSGVGSYLFGIQADNEKAKVYRDLYYGDGNPSLSTLSDKIAYYYSYKKDTVKTLAVFSDLPLDSTATEADYGMAIRLVSRLKNKPHQIY